MRTVKLLISFDGTGYCGWQRQKNGLSIQEEIERALSLICNGDIILHGAGRTDAGVHALGMAAHFATASRVGCAELQKGLNSLLPGAIRIIEASDQPTDFHARFSALARRYRYVIANTPVRPALLGGQISWQRRSLDEEVMHVAGQYLLGEKDFSAFRAASCQSSARG